LLAGSRLNGSLEKGAQDFNFPPGLLKSEKTLAPFLWLGEFKLSLSLSWFSLRLSYGTGDGHFCL